MEMMQAVIAIKSGNSILIAETTIGENAMANVPALLHDVRLPDKRTSLNPNVGRRPRLSRYALAKRP